MALDARLEDREDAGLEHAGMEGNVTSNELERGLLAGDEAARPKKGGVGRLLTLSSATVVAIGAIGMVEYSMVMPSLDEYVLALGQTHVFYGVCMGAFSASRLVMMPLFGLWSDRRPMIQPFIFSVLVAIFGNILYALALGYDSAWLVLVGRICVGFGAANGALSMSYITRVTRPEARTAAMAMLNGLNLVGVVVGPATNLLINDIHFKVGDHLVFNHLTNPGWLMAVLLSLLLVLMLCTFKEPPPASLAEDEEEECEPEAESCARENGAAAGPRTPASGPRTPSSGLGSPAGEELSEPMLDVNAVRLSPPSGSGMYHTLVRRRLWVHFAVSFCSNFVLCELEVALPAMTGTAFGWDTIDNSFMYAVIGLFVALTLLGVMLASRRVQDRRLIGLGLAGDTCALVLACILLRDFHPSFVAFVVVTFILIGSCPMVGAPNAGLYTKRLQEEPESTRKLGLYIGVLQAVNGLSRTVAPLYAGVALTQKDSRVMVYVGPLVVVVGAALLFVANYDRFRLTQDK